jgi:hypothetical protein
MPDLKIGTDAVARLQAGFANANLPNEIKLLQSLQHDCMILVSLFDELLEADWLASSGLEYDLSTYSQTQIDDFKDIQRLAFQEELDSSTLKGYKIVKFDLVEVPPAGSRKFRPSAFLSPMAKKRGPGGGGGTSDPGYPPH